MWVECVGVFRSVVLYAECSLDVSVVSSKEVQFHTISSIPKNIYFTLTDISYNENFKAILLRHTSFVCDLMR